MTLESKIEAGFVRRVKALGGLPLKFTSPGNAGVPDRLVLLPCGCSRFVELKAPGEEPRPLQRSVFARFAVLGHAVEVLDSAAAVADWARAAAQHVPACCGLTIPSDGVM